MSFEKKVWVNVPDPNNPPEIPEGQDALARFDADNMNRIEDGIKDSIKRDGDILEGNLDANFTYTIENLAVPKKDGDAVSKGYVDGLVEVGKFEYIYSNIPDEGLVIPLSFTPSAVIISVADFDRYDISKDTFVFVTKDCPYGQQVEIREKSLFVAKGALWSNSMYGGGYVQVYKYIAFR